jgi:mannose-1-phosphate guanylyltransferase / mannose-6-phosphate isomerase
VRRRWLAAVAGLARNYPKQLFAFGGGRSLLPDTLSRVLGGGYGKPIVVTGNQHRFLVAEQALALQAEVNIVIEPYRRDSCAAIAAAAMVAVKRDPDAILLVLAADHAIPDLKRFQEHIERGLGAARMGRIVTFGLQPSHAATGYGYLRPGPPLDGMAGVRELAAFVEKPDEATARQYVADGYLWNSGNFLSARACSSASSIGSPRTSTAPCKPLWIGAARSRLPTPRP